MRFAFASASCFAPSHGTLVYLEDHRPPNPNRPDPRAVEEMRAFDELSIEARRRIWDSPFGAQVAVLVADVTRRGAPREIQARLQARGLLPCDVGTEGVVLERVAMLEEAERERIKAALVS